MTLMTYAAMPLYAAAIVCSLSAARQSWTFGRPADHRMVWFTVACSFLALLVFRVIQGEDLVRNNLRAFARGHDLYEMRHDYQAALVGIVLVGGALVAFAVWQRWFRQRLSRESLLVRVATVATLAFVPLYALRIISLHAVDALLYAGPVRLNWILELALCLMIMACALAYGQTVKRAKVRADRH